MGNGSTRLYQRMLIGGFVVIIFGMPASQVFVELYREVPVRFTDLFRNAPTRRNLRRYEETLERNWWGQASARPVAEQWLFETLNRTSRKTLPGRDGWLFYRPGVEYLVARDTPIAMKTDSLWVDPGPRRTARQSVVQAIVRFHNQLQQRGLKLLVVPIPGKASIYPDRLTRQARQTWQSLHSPTEELLADLEQQGVKSVDLFRVFRDARTELEDTKRRECLYLQTDTHWTPIGARVAADAVAGALQRLGWTDGPPYTYSTRRVNVSRTGDLVEMLGLPGGTRVGAAENVLCCQVCDPFLQGPLVPNPNDRAGVFLNQHLLDTPMESRYLVLGDSYCRIYQLPEPASLGVVRHGRAGDDRWLRGRSSKQRLLPGSAGFPSLLAKALHAAVDFIVSDGGAATRVRQMLNVTPESLQNKQVVIWEFTERDIQLAGPGWQPVPLPSVP